MGEIGFILTAAGAGLLQVFNLDIFPFVIVGILVGMFLGLVPGLGGLVGFALLIPFSLTMEPLTGIAFLLAMSAVTTQTDTIPAVILGVPGTSAAMATSLDGYPLAKKGQAGRALCASYYASIFGTLVATALFLIFLPILRAVIFAFGQPEFFMLVMLGLILAGSLAGNSLARGLIMAGFGLLLSTVTLETSTGEPRFAGDIIYLWEGVPLLPVILGLFAVPEVVDLARRKSSISQTTYDTRVSGLWWGLKDCLENWWLIIKAGTLGTLAGFIPGLGGQVAEWMAYGSAVASDPGSGFVRKRKHPWRHRARGRNSCTKTRCAYPHNYVRHSRQRWHGDRLGRISDTRIAPRAGDGHHQARRDDDDGLGHRRLQRHRRHARLVPAKVADTSLLYAVEHIGALGAGNHDGRRDDGQPILR